MASMLVKVSLPLAGAVDTVSRSWPSSARCCTSALAEAEAAIITERQTKINLVLKSDSFGIPAAVFQQHSGDLQNWMTIRPGTKPEAVAGRVFAPVEHLAHYSPEVLRIPARNIAPELTSQRWSGRARQVERPRWLSCTPPILRLLWPSGLVVYAIERTGVRSYESHLWSQLGGSRNAPILWKPCFRWGHPPCRRRNIAQHPRDFQLAGRRAGTNCGCPVGRSGRSRHALRNCGVWLRAIFVALSTWSLL